MLTPSNASGAGRNFAFRCRSHALRDLAVVAAIVVLTAAFFAHAVDPVTPAAAARAAAASAPPAQVIAMTTPADACTCP